MALQTANLLTISLVGLDGKNAAGVPVSAALVDETLT